MQEIISIAIVILIVLIQIRRNQIKKQQGKTGCEGCKFKIKGSMEL